MDEMDSQFKRDWAQWAADRRRRNINLPDEDVDALARALMALKAAILNDAFPLPYSGPLVNDAMRKWKPPMAQRFVSLRALDHLRGGGVESALCKEHDPPVSFYRDLVRHDDSLEHKRLAAYLRRLKITLITKDENDRLDDNGFRSLRPPDAYEQCGIERLPYDPHVAEALSRG